MRITAASVEARPVVDSESRPRWFVRYYDAVKSRRGQGVQVREFTDRVEAEVFASHNRLYSKPCRVQEVS